MKRTRYIIPLFIFPACILVSYYYTICAAELNLVGDI